MTAEDVPAEWTPVDEAGKDLGWGPIVLDARSREFVARRATAWHQSAQVTMERITHRAIREYLARTVAA